MRNELRRIKEHYQMGYVIAEIELLDEANIKVVMTKTNDNSITYAIFYLNENDLKNLIIGYVNK